MLLQGCVPTYEAGTCTHIWSWDVYPRMRQRHVPSYEDTRQKPAVPRMRDEHLLYPHTRWGCVPTYEAGTCCPHIREWDLWPHHFHERVNNETLERELKCDQEASHYHCAQRWKEEWKTALTESAKVRPHSAQAWRKRIKLHESPEEVFVLLRV